MIKNFVEDFYQLSDQYGSKEAILFDDENGLSSISYHQLLFLVDQFNTELGDSRKVLSFFSTARKFSEYIKQNDPTSISKDEGYENYMFQRKAIFKNER